MTNWHDFSAAARAALAVLSQGSCWYPGCRTPILVYVNGRPEINVEVLPIRGSAGAAYADLLLLCVPHRRVVDRDERAHPADLLATWQPRHEALRELPQLTPDRFAGLLTSAFFAAKGDVAAALDRFGRSEPDAAELLRHLVDGLGAQRADADVAGALAQVLRRLESLENELGRLAGSMPAGSRAATIHETAKPANLGWTR